MKKTLRRTLAILLAALLALGVSMVASAAQIFPPQSPAPMARRVSNLEASVGVRAIPTPGRLHLSVKTAPTDAEYLLGFESPDLTGLVIAVEQSGMKFDAAWDDNYGYRSFGNIRIYWEMRIDKTELPKEPGDVYVTVHYFGETDNYEDWTWQTFEGTVDVPLKAVSPLSKMTGAFPMALNLPMPTTLIGATDEISPGFYSFTPAQTGIYLLSVSDYPADTAPIGLLAAADGRVLGNASFHLGRQPLQYLLEAGKTYYFALDYTYDKDPVVPYGLTLLVTRKNPAALELDKIKALEVNKDDGYYTALFAFTPSGTGDYCFRSFSSNWDLYAQLFDSDMNPLASNDDGETKYYTPYDEGWLYYSINFKINYHLEEGRTYYLSVGGSGVFYEDYYEAANDASVTVEKVYLRGAGPVNVSYEESPIPFYAMFDTNCEEIAIDAPFDYFDFHKIYDPLTVTYSYGYVPIKLGTATVSATDNASGLQASCRVGINYSWWQWILVICCFGWAWL